MDKQKNHPNPQEQSDQKVKHDHPPSLEQHVNFTDKERKREELDHSTIGGF